MQKEYELKKQISYPGLFLRLISMLIDLTLAAVVISPLMHIITLNLFCYFFESNIANMGTVVKSFEDIRLLMTSEDFTKSLSFIQFIKLTCSTLIVEFLLISVYFVFCWMKFGATIGKFILRMKVMDLSSNANISFTRSLLRYFGYIFGIFSIFSIVITAKRRGVQDYLANSVVIKN